MPLNPLPYREVRRKLRAAGFVEVRQKGTHVIFERETEGGAIIVTVPYKRRDIPLGTLKSILRQAKMTEEEFMAL
jgi:predicted RNA binding protein YcfA (HicA-like mRNA interferase family)